MQINRTYSGNLNQDSSKYSLPPADYSNARNISKDSRLGDQDGDVTGLAGNRLIASAYYRANDKVVGGVDDPLKNRILFAVYNPNGKHRIMLFDAASETISVVITDIDDTAGEVIMGFQADSFIQMNILNRSDDEGALLLYLDGAGVPSVLNIEKTMDGSRKPLTRQRANVIKAPPENCPLVEYANDADKKINNLINKFFRFKSRFVYEDGYKSVWSAVSIMPKPATVPPPVTDPQVTDNVIVVTLSSGPIEVGKIELAVSVSVNNTWSDFMLVDSLSKSIDDIQDNDEFQFKFYNDGVYSFIDINESTLLYDFVPFTAGAQTLINGAVPEYGDITEGYDKTVIPDVRITEQLRSAAAPEYSGTLNFVRTRTANSSGFLSSDRDIVMKFKFSGLLVPGTQLFIDWLYKYKAEEGGTGDFELKGTSSIVSIVGETITGLLNRFVQKINDEDLIPQIYKDYFFQVLTEGDKTFVIDTSEDMYKDYRGDHQAYMRIVTPGSSTPSTTTFLWGTKRRLGLIYYDENGRTNGVITKVNNFDSGLDSNLKDFEVAFSTYSEVDNQPQLPSITTQIHHLPPSWAKYYHWVISKDLTIGSYLFWVTRDVLEDTNFYYFDVSNIKFNKTRTTGVEDVLTYTFAKGDRMRIIRDLDVAGYYTTHPDTAIDGYVVNPKISTVEKTGEFIKVSKARVGITFTIPTNKHIEIMLYTPRTIDAGENSVYYEFGQRFPIVTVEGVNYHGGGFSNQTSFDPAVTEIREGDAYYRIRNIYYEETDDVEATYSAMDANYADLYKSAVNSISGRPVVVDVNAKSTNYPATVRFGGSYQPGTVINNINRFFAENFDDYNLSFGKIKRLKERDKTIRVFQELKCGNVPVYQQIIKDAVGGDILAQSDKLLNKIQYYEGNYGIGDCPESLASNNYADYFVDNRRGIICRLSMDGLTPISMVFNMNSWGTQKLPLRGSGSKVFGVFDAEFNKYIIALQATEDDAADALLFSEKAKSAKGFESFADFYPDFVVCLNTTLVAFKDGRAWVHNGATPANFFGTQYTPSITGVFNDLPQVKKNYTNVKTVANKVWEAVAITTSLGQTSELLDIDFRKKEDSYVAGCLRDSSSPGGLLRGDHLKGNWMEVKFDATTPETESAMVLSTVIANESQLNKR